jgi:hypothetical protein
MLYNCIKVRDIGKYLFKDGQKWENKAKHKITKWVEGSEEIGEILLVQ